MDRRDFMLRSLALGCSAAASPLVTPVALASAPWDNRLVVLILRGGMDGLDVVQPYGDRDMCGLRPNLKVGEAGHAHDLDGFFSLHNGLGSLMPLWTKGELGFAHAVSTPYRDKRSHFDGQDLLEAGTVSLGGTTQNDGWLNRMLGRVPGVQAETTYAIGIEQMLLTKGRAPASSWSPEVSFELSAQAQRLLELVYHDDPLYRAAAAEAIAIAGDLEMSQDLDAETADMMSSSAEMMQSVGKGGSHRKLAEFAASRLRGQTRIAAFSIGGWDTHQTQSRFIERPLKTLSDTILTLRAGLGDVWGKTAVIAMTEFGRTARENGSKGTDHGTGGAMVFAGGAIRGGQVISEWPGLKESELYAGRDLMPTRDVRAHAAWMMRGLFGISNSDLERVVFPDLEMGNDPKILL